MKNHEGYTDLTAYKAIKNVSKKRRKATGAKLSGLTYKIGELQQVAAGNSGHIMSSIYLLPRCIM